LDKYNLIFKNDIALTLEWVNVTATSKSNLIPVGGKKEYCILFNEKQNKEEYINDGVVNRNGSGEMVQALAFI
jgi:hypothetical protein